MNRLLFIIGVLFLSTCQSASKNEASVNRSPDTAESVKEIISPEVLAANQAAFESLLSKVMAERLIAAEDEASMSLIQRFFPNTSRFQNHHVSIEPIAARDSFYLLLYEFISEEEDRNQMFLGSFAKTGNVIDLLEIKAISYDGHLSLNLLEEGILEIEYEDFTIRSDFPNIQANVDRYNPLALPVRSNLIEEEKETSGVRYFRIESDGYFVSLATSDQRDIARVFPQVSSRILSIEELKRLKPNELVMMRNEMYACHGFKFEDVLLENYFKEKDWYQPTSEVDLDKLTEIERINLNRMLNLK